MKKILSGPICKIKIRTLSKVFIWRKSMLTQTVSLGGAKEIKGLKKISKREKK